MLTYKADWLERASEGSWHRPPPEAVHGFSFDTRSLREGEMFLALRTERRDGHDYLDEAHRRGAPAAMVERTREEVEMPQLEVDGTVHALHRLAADWRGGFRGALVGVTGSAGKTSTKDFLFHLLGGEQRVHRTAGNFNNHLGVPLTLLGLREGLHESAVIEAGMNAPGEITALTHLLRPQHGLVTLVGEAHLEGVGSLEGIAAEKASLLQGVEAGGWKVFPESCLAYAPFRALEPPVLVVGAGERPAALSQDFHYARWEALAPESGESGWTVRLCEEGSTLTVPVASPSLGMAANAALALALAARMGVGEKELQARARKWRPSTLRGQLVCAGDVLYYLDCYNANPPALRDALASFTRLTEGAKPRLFVLGSMAELGPEAARLHRESMQGIQAHRQDHFVLIGEYACDLRAGLLATGCKESQVTVAENGAQVRARLEDFPQGAVLLKGSRRYALEEALPEAVRAQVAEGGAPC